MADELPEFYFRIRENGATVFRIDTENRHRRIDMDEIAIVNIKSEQVKPHGDRALSPPESAAIAAWMADRIAALAARDIDDILRAIDHMNLTTQWAQSRASDEALETVTDRLLLAMHDLRMVLVRKKSDRIMRGEAAE